MKNLKLNILQFKNLQHVASWPVGHKQTAIPQYHHQIVWEKILYTINSKIYHVGKVKTTHETDIYLHMICFIYIL